MTASPPPISTADYAVANALATHHDTLVSTLTTQARELFAPIVEQRVRIREALLHADAIHPIAPPDTFTNTNESLICVDGANVTDQRYGADILMALAAAEKGLLGPTPITLPPALTWAKLVTHTSTNGKIVDAARFGLELRTLAHATDANFRILDGATTSPFLTIILGLRDRNTTIRNTVADIVLDNNEAIITAAHTIAGPAAHHIIACPKSDSSSHLTSHLLTSANIGLTDLPASDKLFASLILQPGEMFTPHPIRTTPLDFDFAADDNNTLTAHQKNAFNKMITAVQPLIDALRNKQQLSTYVKPHNADPTNTLALKVEYRNTNTDADPLSRGQHVASRIAAEVRPHFAQEPVPQYIVDQAVKQVSEQIEIIRESTYHNFQPTEKEHYWHLLQKSYRT